MATVNVKKLSPTEAADSFQPTHLWWQRAEDLIEGRSPGFVLTFGGDREDIEKAIDSAIVCFDRYRKRAAIQGRFKDTVYILARRGNLLFVKNVSHVEARKNWKHYDQWMKPHEGNSQT